MKTLKNTTIIISAFALFKLILHLYTNTFAGYGIFRDELYYLACSSHPAAGYVDHPPLSIYILMLSKTLFGDSVFAIRLFPALASAAVVFITGLITRRMGGGTLAVVISCAAITFSPIHSGMSGIFSMNAFDFLFWAAGFYVILVLLQNPRPYLWLLIGIIFGLGALNKTSMLWMGAGFFAGLLLSRHRGSLLTFYPYAAGAAAALIFAPYVIWNAVNGFPHLEFMSNAVQYKYNGISRWDFISGSLLIHNPVNLLVIAAGLYYYFFKTEGREYRPLGIIFVTTFIILIVNGHSKPEYLAPSVTILYPAGGIMAAMLLSRVRSAALRYALPALTGVIGLIILPFALPVLPVETFISYSNFLGIAPDSNEEHQLEALPQFYADMHGWEELASTVSLVYNTLPPSERAKTIVLGNNYGEAGAIDYFRSKYPLPEAVSPHNNYWIWAYPDKEISTVIVIGGDIEDHKKSCEYVYEAAVVKSRYAIPYENNLPVYICSGFKEPFGSIWRRIRFYI